MDLARAARGGDPRRRGREIGSGVFERALAASTDAVCIATRGAGSSGLETVYVNPAFAQLTGYGPDEIIGRDPLDVLRGPETGVTALTTIREDVAAGDAGQIEVLQYRRDGGAFFAEVRFVPVGEAGEDVMHWIFACRDATERWRAESEMLRLQLLEADLANTVRRDDLTGLPNRTLFVSRLRASIDAARRHGVARAAALFLDIDKFKLINDTFGHLAGDQLLVEVARRLERYVRRTDTVARIGGDEFMVLLDGVDDDAHAATLGQRIIEGLAEPFSVAAWRESELCMTTSIGIAMVHGTYEDPDEVLRDADSAMYRAKRLGRGHCVVFTDEPASQTRAASGRPAGLTTPGLIGAGLSEDPGAW